MQLSYTIDYSALFLIEPYNYQFLYMYIIHKKQVLQLYVDIVYSI